MTASTEPEGPLPFMSQPGAAPATPLPRRRAVAALGLLTLALPWKEAMGQFNPLLMGPDELARLRAQARLSQHRQALERDPHSPWIGAAAPTATLVVFSDYRCPFCRKLSPMLDELLRERPTLRIVLKEWPIFGGVSETAARAALAATRQDGYWALHQALMGTTGLSHARIMTLAREQGLDVESLQGDLDAPHVSRQLEATTRLAEALDFRGTPTIVAGERIVPGAVEKAELLALVDAAAAG